MASLKIFVMVLLCGTSVILRTAAANVAELPHCVTSEKQTNGFIVVSTLDGKVTTIDGSGTILWTLDTGPGPLLMSNIHNIELTNNEEWVRIIPSMSGSLYKFNGRTIEAIPLSADSLLKSSFVYSNDLVIAGGREVRTYGVAAKTGKHVYSCSLEGCHNITTHDTSLDEDDVIIVERSTSTVRAHGPRTGNERWNFSVGQHNIKLPFASCLTLDYQVEALNLTAIIPEGLIVASTGSSGSRVWDYKLNSPVEKLWKWNGRDLIEVDLLNDAQKRQQPAIYLGMHDKQLYIHESKQFMNTMNALQLLPMADEIDVPRIPWKPISASAETTYENDDSTALSVLYSSEYVNGNGFYLYMDSMDKQADMDSSCADTILDNTTIHDGTTFTDLKNLWFYWKEIVVISATTALAFNAFLNYGVFRFFKIFYNKKTNDDSKNAVSSRDSNCTENTVTINIDADARNGTSRISSESSDFEQFASRYADDFEIVQCLGKGGYGIVFEVKQKIDECAYAIKRITLPSEEKSRDRVLREVKALANLDHVNIVRYFNSWLECPPAGWADEFDRKWMIAEEEDGEDTQMTATIDMKAHNSWNTTCTDSCGIVFEHSGSGAVAGATAAGYSTTSNSKMPVLDAVKPNMYLYIQMQLCQKDSLRDWLLSNPRRTHSTIIDIYEQILLAVIYVHGQGLIHRDLKPSNIFFSKDGKVKVGDFGLVTPMNEHNADGASSLESILKSHTRGAGTTLYMSPEQLVDQQYNYKVDIFSLGVILFELLVPFGTAMERYERLSQLRDGHYPAHFASAHAHEHKLLECMLSAAPATRPSAEDVLKELTRY